MSSPDYDPDITAVTVLDNQYATLWYYPDHKIVHHQFHQFVFSDALRSVLNKGLATLQEHGAQKWLSDDRHHSAIIPEDVHWSQTVWFPRAVESGWKHWAIVTPQSLVGAINLQTFARQCTEQGVQTRFFNDPIEALAWLVAV